MAEQTIARNFIAFISAWSMVSISERHVDVITYIPI